MAKTPPPPRRPTPPPPGSPLFRVATQVPAGWRSMTAAEMNRRIASGWLAHRRLILGDEPWLRRLIYTRRRRRPHHSFRLIGMPL